MTTNLDFNDYEAITDLLNLLKVDDQWQVMNKVFSPPPINVKLKQ